MLQLTFSIKKKKKKRTVLKFSTKFVRIAREWWIFFAFTLTEISFSASVILKPLSSVFCNRCFTFGIVLIFLMHEYMCMVFSEHCIVCKEAETVTQKFNNGTFYWYLFVYMNLFLYCLFLYLYVISFIIRVKWLCKSICLEEFITSLSRK